jgi:hypothetical protein
MRCTDGRCRARRAARTDVHPCLLPPVWLVLGRLRLATPALVCELTGLTPYEIRCLCDRHPGLRAWVNGGPLVDVRGFLRAVSRGPGETPPPPGNHH